MTGTGANGKSTLANILRRSMGGLTAGAYSSVPFRDIGKEFANIRLFGKLFNIMEESESFLDRAQFETLKDYSVGGLVSGSKKFKDAIEFENFTKFIIICNELPKGGTPNQGLYRRLLICPFNADFQGEVVNPNLADEICSEELSGIMNLLVQGYWALKKRNYSFKEAPVVSAMLEEYKHETDNVARWASLNLAQGAGEECIAVRELRSKYESWVTGDGEKPVAINQFTKRLMAFCKGKKINIKYYPQKKIAGLNVPAIEGIRLGNGEEF
jgi:putative DNA primase/helicase